MTKLHELKELGQSVWLDYIRRALMTSGELDDLIAEGLRGMTSNPTIFEKAIAGSDDYTEQLQALVAQGKSELAIYEALAIQDIQDAADRFRTVFDADPTDGYVSLEANPHLAHDTQGTIEEIRRLHKLVDRPNVMFKVPATREGIPAIEQLLSEGININITLMFSVQHYDLVAEAFLRALETRVNNGEPVDRVASVASFFVSRMDSKLDPRLEERGLTELKGAIGVANAKSVYQRFTQVFGSARWKRLEQQGAQVQRVLWGSTSTKDPAYPDTLYVDNLIGPHTVNTLPPETLDAFRDHGTVARTVDRDWSTARTQLERLSKAGIDILQVGEELQTEGVDKFIASFDELIKTIATQRETLQSA